MVLRREMTGRNGAWNDLAANSLALYGQFGWDLWRSQLGAQLKHVVWK